MGFASLTEAGLQLEWWEMLGGAGSDTELG